MESNALRPEGTYKREGKIIRLYNQQDGKCFYCGCQMILFRNEKEKNLPISKNYATKEHLLPRVDGGVDNIYNLVAACHKCNLRRGHKDLYKFKAIKEMEQFYNSTIE